MNSEEFSEEFCDRRTRGHKGVYAAFWEDVVSGLIRCDVFSSRRSALTDLKNYTRISQSLHDASGHLIAYSNNGKVVMCNAHS
jgi:hypothetical protein